MKKILKYFIIIVVLNFFCKTVYAFDLGGHGSYGTPMATTGYGNGGGNGGVSVMPIAYGYRVTIVDSGGIIKEGTHIHDFWSSRYSKGSWNGVWGYIGFKDAISPNLNGKGWYNTILWTYGFGNDGLANKKIKLKYYYPKNYSSQPITNTYHDIVARDGTTLHDSIKLFNEASEETIIGSNNYYGATPGGGSSGTGALTNNAGIAVQLQKKLFDIIDDLKINAETLTEEQIDNKIKPFVDLINACSNSGTSLDIRSLNGYYLVIEPLIAINRSDKLFYIYAGTAKELYKMGFYNDSENIKWQYTYYSYHNPLVYYDGNSSIANINSCSSTDPMSFGNISTTLGDNGCGGVFVIDISGIPIFPEEEECIKTARNRFNDAKALKDKDKYYKALTGYDEATKKYTIEEDPKYEKYKNGCFPSGVSGLATDDYGLNMKDCYQLSYDYVNKVGGDIPESVEYYVGEKKVTEEINLCQPVSCNGALATIKEHFTYDKNDESYKKEEPKTNYALAVKYILEKIAKPGKFKDSATINSNDFLDYNVYNALGQEAKCDTALLECPLEGDGKISCNDKSVTKTFTIKDSTKDECVHEGYSYSGISTVNKVVQSAVDYNYVNNEVFCYEEVDFELPGKPETEAGTLLGWGKNNNVIETGYFGTMTVKRRCEFNNFNSGEGIDDINIRWIENLDTEIILNYHDRNNYSFNNQMDIKFNDFRIENITGIDKKIFAEGIYNDSFSSEESYHYMYGEELYNDLTNYECNEKNNYCKGIKELKTSAEYSIMYPSSLQWYADKINPFDPASAEELEVHEEPINVAGNYIYLGYGLVTSFADPTCEFGGTVEEFRSEEQLKNSTSNSGELSVTIKYIGTRIRPNDKSQHHFDKIFQLNIGEQGGIEDNKFKPGDDISERDYLYYSCPFDISNKLFGTEYGSTKDCDPPTESGSPEGLDVVFRTINLMEDDDVDSLLKAFPSRAGSGRLFGDNWFKLTNGDKFTTSRIYSLLRNDIYNEKEPMYHIELTSSTIKKIREDNKALKEAGKNPYSNMDNDTYLFYNNVIDSILLKLYDVDRNKKINAVDATFILTCNNDPNWHEVCPNVIVGKEKAKVALDYAVKSSVVESMLISDKTSIHVSSLYLDTLKDNYGLTGVCMDTDAEGRLEKYKKNGCHYNDRPEIELSEEDLGKSFYRPVIEYLSRFEGATLYSAFSNYIDASTTEDGDDDGDIITTIGGFYNQHPADDDGDIYFTEGYDFSE